MSHFPTVQGDILILIFFFVLRQKETNCSKCSIYNIILKQEKATILHISSIFSHLRSWKQEIDILLYKWLKQLINNLKLLLINLVRGLIVVLTNNFCATSNRSLNDTGFLQVNI